MLQVNNLTVELKSYKENFYILRDFSLHINKGEIFDAKSVVAILMAEKLCKQ